ncbi:MAG TPA: hypothetical protein VF766_13660, partial [Pyrinomonadaceae bacterium]
MKRTFHVLARSVILLALCVQSFGQGQAPRADDWTDYASGDYDILPNITYSTANNIELKLDL